MRNLIIGLVATAAIAGATPVLAQQDCGTGGRTTIYYDVGKTAVTDAHKAKLSEFASVAQHRNRTCVLAQVDAQGSEEANKRVAAARAENVVAYLVAQGVARDSIIIATEQKGSTLFGLIKSDQEGDRSVTVTHK